MTRTDIIASRSDTLDENERLKHDVNAYFGIAQEQANTSFGHDRLALRTPETDAIPQEGPRQLPQLLPLFDDQDNTVNFNDVVAGSYFPGTQYQALDGNDHVLLPTDINEANQSGYDVNAIFRGGEGNDKINGGGEFADGILDDKIDGGAGNDIVTGGGGNDMVWGGDGVDHVIGGTGDDKVWGGDGDDNVYGLAGNDMLFGGDDQDHMYGYLGDDIIQGDAGNDYLFGDTENDLLIGGSGHDILMGGGHDDQLYGGDGNDTLFDADFDLMAGIFKSGYSGEDVLNGGAGNDALAVTTYDDAADLMIGGSGKDTFSLIIEYPHEMPWAHWDTILDFENGQDTIYLINSGGNYLDSFSDLKIVDVNGDSYIFSKEDSLPIVIVKNAGGLLDASDFTFHT